MTALTQKGGGSYSVVAQRTKGSRESLNDFPTPPWATRALMVHVLARLAPHPSEGQCNCWSAWEPACGRGIMAEVLAERFPRVHPSDVHDYGKGYAVGSFVGEGADVARWPDGYKPDWIITNPPFKLAEAFIERALREARIGVAMLCRLALMEGGRRHELFKRDPYFAVCPFVERVPMVEGRWDPDASTATAYAWFVWTRQAAPGRDPVVWPIPPGCREALTGETDRVRFAG